MKQFDPSLLLNQSITNKKLQNIFKCAKQGGMRRSHKTNTLVVIADHTRPLYKDRWDNNIIYYTGMGRVGDQSLAYMQNKTLYESNENGVGIHLFEVFKKNEYTYRGKFKLIGKPLSENQYDENNELRKVWLFPLKLEGEDSQRIFLEESKLRKIIEKAERKAKSMSLQDLRKRVKAARNKASKREVTSTQYERDPYVAELAKRLANGKCDLCGGNAPFLDKNNIPFLEAHHIKWISKGGADSIDNTAALCPNCHRKMHILDKRTDIKKLTVAVEQRKY